MLLNEIQTMRKVFCHTSIPKVLYYYSIVVAVITGFSVNKFSEHFAQAVLSCQMVMKFNNFWLLLRYETFANLPPTIAVKTPII